MNNLIIFILDDHGECLSCTEAMLLIDELFLSESICARTKSIDLVVLQTSSIAREPPRFQIVIAFLTKLFIVHSNEKSIPDHQLTNNNSEAKLFLVIKFNYDKGLGHEANRLTRIMSFHSSFVHTRKNIQFHERDFRKKILSTGSGWFKVEFKHFQQFSHEVRNNIQLGACKPINVIIDLDFKSAKQILFSFRYLSLIFESLNKAKAWWMRSLKGNSY